MVPTRRGLNLASLQESRPCISTRTVDEPLRFSGQFHFLQRVDLLPFGSTVHHDVLLVVKLLHQEVLLYKVVRLPRLDICANEMVSAHGSSQLEVIVAFTGSNGNSLSALSIRHLK